MWVRLVLDDSAVVLPVTFDAELADEHSLIIPDGQAPLGLELVVMASVEAEIDLRANAVPVRADPGDSLGGGRVLLGPEQPGGERARGGAPRPREVGPRRDAGLWLTGVARWSVGSG